MSPTTNVNTTSMNFVLSLQTFFPIRAVFPFEYYLIYCESQNGIGYPSYWEELPCGIYSVWFDASSSGGGLVGEVRRHEYSNSMLKELIKWDRTSIEPKFEDLHTSQYPSSRRQLDVSETVSYETGDFIYIIELVATFSVLKLLMGYLLQPFLLCLYGI